MGKQGHFLAALEAPTAFVAVPQFEEINGAVVFGKPSGIHDFPPGVIHLYHGPRAQERDHHLIFQADKTVAVFLEVELAQQSRWNLSPRFDQARKEHSLLRPESRVEADGKADGPRRVTHLHGK